MVLAPLISSQGNSKFDLVIMQGGTLIFMTMGGVWLLGGLSLTMGEPLIT